MRKDWEYKKLGEVAFYPNDKISVDKIGANHYVGVENLLKDKAGILFSDQLPNAATATCFKYNDILLGNIRPYLKKIWLSNTEGGASGDVIVIRTSSDNILPNYLFKLLSSDKFFNYFNLYTKGAKMPRGDKNAIAKFIVPTPPKPTQLAIVAELDKINELIQLKKQQLKDYDQLAQSIFYEMFGDPVENEKGWEVKKLGEVCETSSGGTPSKTHTEYYENGTIPWLRSGEVSQGYIYDAEIYISELGLNKSSAKIFPKDTVLIAMYGATVGEVGILCNPMCTNQAICGILPNDLYNSEFLRYVLLSHKDKYLSLASGGAQPNISQQIIKSTLIPFIDKPLQQQFAARIEAIERQKQQVSETIKGLETLLASRMQYWFD